MYSVHRDGVTWWESTIAGSALAQASFRPAITRATAERHLAGVIERAKKINADESSLVDVTELVVFGSYLDSDGQDLGDLDLGVALRSRVLEVPSTAEQREVVLNYARARGQGTGNLLNALSWPEKEALKILRNRSAVIHLTLEDVRALTDRWEVVYRTNATARPKSAAGRGRFGAPRRALIRDGRTRHIGGKSLRRALSSTGEVMVSPGHAARGELASMRDAASSSNARMALPRADQSVVAVDDLRIGR